MRLLVTGSRLWTDRQLLKESLDDVFREHYFVRNEWRPLVLVHGACPRGADAMADDWGRSYSLDVIIERHPADWDKHGKAAGFIRNAEMVSLGADLCIAFVVPGKSKGTQHTINLARKAGIPVQEVTANG